MKNYKDLRVNIGDGCWINIRKNITYQIYEFTISVEAIYSLNNEYFEFDEVNVLSITGKEINININAKELTKSKLNSFSSLFKIQLKEISKKIAESLNINDVLMDSPVIYNGEKSNEVNTMLSEYNVILGKSIIDCINVDIDVSFILNNNLLIESSNVAIIDIDDNKIVEIDNNGDAVVVFNKIEHDFNIHNVDFKEFAENYKEIFNFDLLSLFNSDTYEEINKDIIPYVYKMKKEIIDLLNKFNISIKLDFKKQKI